MDAARRAGLDAADLRHADSPAARRAEAPARADLRSQRAAARTGCARGAAGAARCWPLSLLFGALAALRARRSTASACCAAERAAGAGDRRRQRDRRRRGQDADGASRWSSCCAARGCTPGVVSRGYGAARRGCVEVDAGQRRARGRRRAAADRAGARGVPVFVGRDRVAAGARAAAARIRRSTSIVSDDGLQHYALAARHRGAACSTSAAPATAGCCRPGRCASRCRGAAAAPASCSTTRDAPTTPLPGCVAQRAARRRDRARRLVARQRRASRRSRRCAAAASSRPPASRNPERFFAMLRGAGLDCRRLPLPDHHDFADACRWPAGTADVVVHREGRGQAATRTQPARPARLGRALDFVPAPASTPRCCAADAAIATRPDPHGHPTA